MSTSKITRSRRLPLLALSAAIALAGSLGAPWHGPATAQQGGWQSRPETSPSPDRERERTTPPPRRTDPFADPPPGRPGAAPKDGPKNGKAAKAPPEPKPIPRTMKKPGGSSVPEGAGERAKLLDELYAHLATAEDEASAKRVASAIEHIWMTTGSDTVSLLMERARRAMRDKSHDQAIRFLDRAAQLAPDYPEVFNQRAAVHYVRNNMQSAVGDLRRVLALDPNHYKALEALGQIFKEMDRKKAALEVYRKLYDVNPHMPNVKSTFEELQREIEGQPT